MLVRLSEMPGLHSYRIGFLGGLGVLAVQVSLSDNDE
jgi:hypothetical protein